MPLPLRRAISSLLSLVALAAATSDAFAETRTAQIGSGFEARIRCEGARLSYHRKDPRSVRLECRADGVVRGIPTSDSAVRSVQLELGEQMRVLCQGARLKTRRTSRTEMRASCVV
jgi:hypothetical protein